MPDCRHALRKHVASLTDAQLIGQLGNLVGEERRVTAKLLVHLAEVDSRKLYLKHACTSMHAYCVKRLHMSEPRAYLRIQAARTARRHPRIFDMVANNELHLSAIALLAPHLTCENHVELLGNAAHKSKREVERLLAEYFPQPDAPQVVRQLPSPQSPTPSQPAAVEAHAVVAKPAPPPVVARSTPPPVVRPTTPERFEIQFTATAELHDKLREAQALLRHQVADGDVAEIFERALDALLAETKRKRFAATPRPRGKRGTPTARTRHIPNDVKRAVLERDGGRCTYEDEDGNRCNANSPIEFHHIKSFATGGEHSVENITLRCRPHNRFEAEQELGRGAIAERIQEAREARQAQLHLLSPRKLRDAPARYRPRTHARRQLRPDGARDERASHRGDAGRVDDYLRLIAPVRFLR